MSRNKTRTRVPITEEKEIQPHIPPEKPNPFGISFVVPTELVHLPSGGNFYEEGSPIQGLETIEIKALTAKEEDILINESFIENGVVFDRLLESIIVTPGINPRDLLDCDKAALLAAARRSGYGDALEYESACPECGQVSQFQISISKMLSNARDNKFKIESTDEWAYNTSSGLLSFKLPVTGITVDIKLLSKKDQQYIAQDRERRQKLNLPYNDTIEFLRKALVAADSVTDPNDLVKLIEVLPAADARRIKYVHNINIPRFNTSQKVQCPACSAEVEKEVPFSVGWFWSI